MSEGAVDLRWRGLALVTGATGFIGSHLMEELRAHGIPVRVADLPSADFSRARALGCETCPLDLSDPASIERACFGVEVAYHVAAIFDYTTPWETMQRVNVAGAETMARAAHRAGARRMLFFSSVGVYGRPEVAGVAEEGRKNPRNDYERSKWLGEQAVMAAGRETGLEVTAVRPTLVFGPRSRFGHAIFIATFALLGSARRVRPLRTLIGGPLVHSVHARDVARAAHFVAERGVAGEAYNVADRTPLPLGEFGKLIGDATGVPLVPWVRYYPRTYRAAQRVLFWLSPWLLPRWDGALQAAWKRRVERHRLEPALNLRIDREWLNYPSGDHSYDVGKLERLGFTWAEPDVRVSLPATIRWYQENRWIPLPAAVQAMADGAGSEPATGQASPSAA